LGPIVDPEWALYHLARALWDPVDPERMGSLRPELQFRINGEVYRFADERTLMRFMRAPTLWCGTLRDPVSGNRFIPSTASPQSYWVGGPYFFETEANRDRFNEDPARYAVIRRM
jgi:YHS domain-containing protein